jgi:cbb3-type cytochrome oxidase maturation protein
MEILIVTVFVSLVLVVGGLIFFVSRLRDGDFDHGERLSLLPLADDTSEEQAAPDGTASAGDAES